MLMFIVCKSMQQSSVKHSKVDGGVNLVTPSVGSSVMLCEYTCAFFLKLKCGLSSMVSNSFHLLRNLSGEKLLQLHLLIIKDYRYSILNVIT